MLRWSQKPSKFSNHVNYPTRNSYLTTYYIHFVPIWNAILSLFQDFSLPGYQERLTACVKAHEKPCYLSEVWFWLAAMLLLTWPYRWFFRRLSSKVYVIFIKELEVWHLWCTWSENDHLKEENSQIHIPYCQYKVVILIPINFWPHNFYYSLMRNSYFFFTPVGA